MSSLIEPVKFSIEPPSAEGPKPVIYIYDRDIPTKIRPHERHRLIVTGDPEVTTIGRTSPCPCQLYFDSLPNTPFATEELEKEFWSELHLMMPQRDAVQTPQMQRFWRRWNRARKAAARKAKDNGEGPAQKMVIDSSTSSDSDDDDDDKEARERRQQRSGGGTAVESVAERVESDRRRREFETRTTNTLKF